MTNLTVQRIDNPANLPSLPEWLTSRLGMVSRESVQTNGRWSMKPTLLASQALTSSERMAVESHKKALDAVVSKSSVNDRETANNVLGAVARLLKVFAPKDQSETAGEAMAEAYMIALEDIPFWAVESAIHGWYRGEVGEHDYQFCPKPGVLREIAQAKLAPVRNRSYRLGGLLEAVVKPEFSEEHQEQMRNKLAALSLELKRA